MRLQFDGHVTEKIFSYYKHIKLYFMSVTNDAIT